MKPEKIKGLNRIRDCKIVVLYKRDHLSVPEIAAKFQLSERRIQQILRTNHAFVKVDKEWEKAKRINNLQRWIKNSDDPKGNKLFFQNELKTELEGDKDQNSNKSPTIIIIRPEANQTTEGKPIDIVRPEVEVSDGS